MIEDTRQLYPLSAPSGDPIPYNVFRPLGYASVYFSGTVSSTFSISPEAELLIMFSDVACLVCLNSIAEIPANVTYVADTFFLPANMVWIVDHNAAETLSAISQDGTTAGYLHINLVKKWKDMYKPVQGARG